MAAGLCGPPYCPVCWAPVEVSNLRPGFSWGRSFMREIVILAAAGFLILIMAAALIVHFVVP